MGIHGQDDTSTAERTHEVPEPKRLYLYGGAYATTDDARADLEHLRELHGGKHIGRYDALAISKKPDGSVSVIDLDTTVHRTGAWKGALAGGALMVLFPPSVLVGAVAGAAAGAIANDMNKRISRSDADGLADLLAPGESGVLVVVEDIEEAYSTALLKRATRQRAVAIDADADVVDEALRAARDE
jgi:uncharacterized membrane protein